MQNLNKRLNQSKKLKLKEKRKTNKLYFVIFITSIVFFIFSAYFQLKVSLVYKNNIDDLNQKIENEQYNNEQLQKEYEHKESDEFYEKIAREQLGMIAENEIIFKRK